MAGVSPNPDPSHDGESGGPSGGKDARLQSEVQRLHYLLEAKNLEVTQMQSAVVEYEQLTKELAEVLLKYHRHCLTASRGKIPRYRARMERVNHFCEESCTEAKPLQNKFREAKFGSPALSCKVSPLSCTQPGAEKRKNVSDVTSHPLVFSRSCDRLRDSGWSIRWGQDTAVGTNMQYANNILAHESRIDASTCINGEEAPVECVNYMHVNGLSKKTNHIDPISEQDVAKKILDHDRFRDDEHELDDILDGNNFLSTLSSLSMRDRNQGNGQREKFDESTGEVFRFSGVANKVSTPKTAMETGTSTPMGSTTTSVASKRPKPADSLGLADKYLGRENRLTEHTISPFSVGFPAPASKSEGQKLIGLSPHIQELGDSTTKSISPLSGRYCSNQGDSVHSPQCELSGQRQQGTAFTLQNTMTGEFVEDLPRLKPIRTRVESQQPSVSSGFISPASRDIHHKRGYQNRTESHPDTFSNCGGPKGDPPLDCTTPLKQLPCNEEGIKETLTAKLDRFERLIGAKFPSQSPKLTNPSPGRYDSTSQPCGISLKFEMSSGPKYDKQWKVGRRECIQNERKETRRESTRVLMEKQEGSTSIPPNESTPTSALGVQHSHLGRPTMISTLSLDEKENRTVMSKTRSWASKEPGEEGKSAYESMLTMIKDGAYQLRKVTPVTKRRGTRARRVTSKPFMGSTFRRYLHARRQAIGDSDVDSDI